MHKPKRAHVVGCSHALSVPVDLCACGGRDFLTDHQRAQNARMRKVRRQKVKAR